jgi:hypothetical protein
MTVCVLWSPILVFVVMVRFLLAPARRLASASLSTTLLAVDPGSVLTRGPVADNEVAWRDLLWRYTNARREDDALNDGLRMLTGSIGATPSLGGLMPNLSASTRARLSAHAFFRSQLPGFGEKCCLNGASWLASSPPAASLQLADGAAFSTFWSSGRDAEIAAGTQIVPGQICAQFLPVAARRMADESALRAAHAAKRREYRAALLARKEGEGDSKDKDSAQDKASGADDERELLALTAAMDLDDAEGGVHVCLWLTSTSFTLYAGADDAPSAATTGKFTLPAVYATLPVLTLEQLGLPLDAAGSSGGAGAPTFELARVALTKSVLETAREAWSELRYSLVQQHVLVQGSGGELVTMQHHITFHRLLNSVFNAVLHDSFVVDKAFSAFLTRTIPTLAVCSANAGVDGAATELPSDVVAAASALPLAVRLLVVIPCTLKRVELVEALLDSESGVSGVDGPLAAFFRFVAHQAQSVVPIA